MKLYLALITVGTVLSLTTTGFAAGGTGQAFYGDPPDDHHPWCVHDRNRPQPPVVAPLPVSELEQKAKAPADAIVLFDGTEASLANWVSDKNPNEPTKWIVRDGAMECVPKSGYIRSKAGFGDCQLHVEWAAPSKVEGESQGRGNSGIFILGVEIQVLDSYKNPTYADGMACSMYGVNPPLANALRPPGEFQYVDITFHRPVYKDDKLVEPGWVTVFCNGVLVQDRTQLEGPTGHRARTKPGPLPEKGPLRLQDHGNPVRFRNIWYRPLPPAAAKGGVRGPLSVEATMAKRKELAGTIRSDAAKHAGEQPAEMLRLFESVVYEKDAPTSQKAEAMAAQYVEGLKQLFADKLAAKKDEVIKVSDAFKYLAKFEFLPATFGPKADIEKLIKAQGWIQAKGKGKKK
ncbi:MAG: DUF1080 domain-containing protein [Verrucomicrobia bacterium]|nr:DUF1080 domain-containing protein [Verrucomicrobiota bacterium]